MSIFRRLAFVFALLFVALPATGPTLAQDATDTAPMGAITPQDSAQLDADIAVRLREILEEMANYPDVTVAVSEGIVTFRGTATTQADADALSELAARIEGVVTVRNDVTETSDIVERLNPAIERFKERAAQFLNFLPIAVIAALVFGLIVWIGFRIARAHQPWERLAPNAFIADLYRHILRIAFVIVGVVLALDIMNATALLSTILGAAGIIGLAIGFAVRDTVENFIASVMLSIRQPFAPNDTIEINGDEGKVIRLTSRATILLSFDGNHIRIPNATVFKSRIVNYSRNPERRFKLTLCVDSSADLAEMRNLAIKTVQELPFTLEHPASNAWLGDITDGGTQITIVGWIDQRETSLVRARGEALRFVKHAIEAAGVEIPDTTYRIVMNHPDSVELTPAPVHSTAPAPQAEDVKASSEEELDRIVQAERDTGEGEDLLRNDALKE
ncbi:mechanosensitive ion channel family protein [Aestuariibius sp. HNIBRBA575]|uniref:mechanosensitive ion channel family protein n=1 Tax=Aestuariibius sp. HNIBRBA575 TaxID=3233343 RepID=UPI0034A1F131